MIAPAALQGHWRRTWLRAGGVEDRATRVHWLQAGRWCADIRVPLDRPGVSGTLASLPPDALAVLRTAEGFAGHIALAGDVCTWARTWNWRGFPCPPDVGRLWFDGPLLREDGVHAAYAEEWERVPGAPYRAWSVAAGAESGLLIANDADFLLALGTPGAPPAATPAAAFASVYILGHWADGAGIADLSTQPFCEGAPVLTRDGDRARLILPDFHGVVVARDLALTPA